MNALKSKTAAVWAILLTLMLLVTNVPVALAAEDDVIADPNLRQALIDAGADIGGDNKLSEDEMEALSGLLDLSGKSISDLAGLTYATGVTELDLSNNDISDISELSELNSLASLNLSDNELTDIDALYNVDNPPEAVALVTLDVTKNHLDITDGSNDRKVIDALRDAGCNVIYIQQKPVAVTGVELAPSAVELCPGDTKTLTASVLPQNASNKEVVWQSSKPAVATVTGLGVVKAVAVGTTTITVTTKDGLKTDTCSISVKSPKLTSSKYFVGTSKVRGVPALTKVASFKSGFDNAAANLFIYNGSSEYTGSIVKTGLIVRLVVDGVVRGSRTIVVEGDVSGDGIITVDDYTRLKLKLLGKKKLSSPYDDAGDYNRDGELTVADYVRLRLNILGLGDTGGPLPANLPKVSDSRIRKFLDIALAQLGKPYVWGGDRLEDGGFDCSGFVYYSLNKAGYKVGRSSADTYSRKSNWKYVDKDKLQPGDLMFYFSDTPDDGDHIGHIGIYLGNGYHVHASSDYQCIIICGVEGWYERALSHGRRVFQ